MNSYKQKQEAKRDRLEAAADRADERADAAYRKSDLREEVSGIPLGQPIIIGSSGEARHRAAIKRAGQAMDRSVAESKKARELRAKAAAVGTGGISSDDPDAAEKLQAKIDKAQQSQDFMKRSNKIIRKAVKDGVEGPDSDGWAGYMEKLTAIPGGDKYTESAAAELLKPDFCGRIGFASYQLTNNNANIKRMQQRLSQIKKAAERDHVEIDKGNYKVVQNVEENRLQFIFDGKPSAEVRKVMKSNGFRWAPSQEAWQRQLTNNAIRSGKIAMAEMEALA